MVLNAIAIIIITSVVIFFAGSRFATASSFIGDWLRLPRSVKGATFDAISSSLPELSIAIFSLIAFNQFDIGIGTITGSALFNLLVIPALSVFVAPVVFKVGPEVVHRDGFVYCLTVVGLLMALLFAPIWGFLIPILFLIGYWGYLFLLYQDSKIFQNATRSQKKKLHPLGEIIIALILIAVIAAAAFYLTGASIDLANSLGIHPFIIGFTVVAAATSIPDTVISVVNARRGQIDDSVSNVFGSNIFDILIGLSIPLLIANFLFGPVQIDFEHIELVFGLLIASLLSIYYFSSRGHTLVKKEAVYLLIIYCAFIGYAIFLSFTS